MQPGPGGAQYGGAQCALHPGVGANFVCARCGNFMCAVCALSGTEKQCPTCRALNPIGFPYDANADLGTLWGHATAAFQRDAVMCVLGGVVFLVFTMGGGLIGNIITSIVTKILGLKFDATNLMANLNVFGTNMIIGQLVNQVVTIAVQGIALVGLFRLLMDVLVGKKADLARMFSQLHLLPQYLAMQAVLLLFVTVPTLVVFSGVSAMAARMIDIDFKHLSSFRWESLANPQLLALVFGSAALFLVVMGVLLPVTLFATPELIVGQCGPLEALKRAWDLGEGQRLRICGYAFVGFVVYLAGVVFCGIGILITLPVAIMLLLSLYLALRRSSALPPALHS